MGDYSADFNRLLEEDNFIGAWAWVKNRIHDQSLQAAHAGELAKKLLEKLGQAQAGKDRESEAWYRSNLAYVLRDFPGLGALYREQTRTGFREQSTSEKLKSGVEGALRDISDIAEGRTTVEEKLKETLDTAGAQFREGFSSPFFSGIAKGLSDGLQELGKILESPGSPLGTEKNQKKAANDSAQTEQKTASAPGASKSDQGSSATKVKIENADDPLPRPLEKADPGD